VGLVFIIFVLIPWFIRRYEYHGNKLKLIFSICAYLFLPVSLILYFVFNKNPVVVNTLFWVLGAFAIFFIVNEVIGFLILQFEFKKGDIIIFSYFFIILRLCFLGVFIYFIYYAIVGGIDKYFWVILGSFFCLLIIAFPFASAFFTEKEQYQHFLNVLGLQKNSTQEEIGQKVKEVLSRRDTEPEYRFTPQYHAANSLKSKRWHRDTVRSSVGGRKLKTQYKHNKK